MISPAHGAYAFLHARLGAMKAELLPRRLWERLLGAGSFAEQRQALAGTAYAPWLGDAPEAAQTACRNALHQAARKIERSAPPAAADFIRAWTRRDLLRNLKTILQGKALGRPSGEIERDLLRLERPEAPSAALLRCANLEAALDLLECTPLRRWIRAARQLQRRDPSLFGLDAALDRLYYPELRRPMERLAPSDREGVRGLVELEIDQANLLWLFRYRFNYGLSPAEAYYLLTPVTGRVTARTLEDVARQGSLEASVSRLPAGPLRSLLAGCGSIWQAEAALWRLRARQARRALREAAFTLGEALALLVLKVIEVRDLIAVLEGVRLGASRGEILEQLAGAAGD
jgi:V/A-type H+-transporting ATPase subunit C